MKVAIEIPMARSEIIYIKQNVSMTDFYVDAEMTNR